MTILPADHPRLWKRTYSHGELVADAFVHAVAIVAGVIAFAYLFVRVSHVGAATDVLAMAVYAAGFFLLWGFSCAYNMVPPSPLKWLLRRFDHSCIYLMIAGTYTAIISQIGVSVWSGALIAVVWAGALAGAALKLLAPGRFDGLSIAIYLLLGWAGIVAIEPLVAVLPGLTLMLIVVGGAVYSVGVLFYKWHALKFQNAIWHACVAVAAGLQFAGVAYAVGRVV